MNPLFFLLWYLAWPSHLEAESTFGSNIDSAIEIYNKMKSSGKANIESLNKKIDKINEIKNEINKEYTGIDQDKVRLMAAAGVKKTGEGINKVAKGIQAGDYVEIATGALNMITSVTEMLTEIGKNWGPRFKMLTEVLSIISAVLSLFGGSTAGQESCEGMIKRVVEKALTEAKAEELRADVNGLRRYFGALSNSIKEFRKQNDITEEQARNFFTKAFEGVVFFGKLQFYMEKWCEIGDAKVLEAEKDGKQNVKEKAMRCLTMCNLYAELSLLRQTLLFDLGCFLQESGKKAEANETFALIKQEQKADQNILKFFTDPISYRSYRAVHLYFYSRVGDYPILYAYLQSLHELMKREEEVNYLQTSVMICDDLSLKGNCFSYKDVTDDEMLEKWNDKVRSFYISGQRELIAFEHRDYKGKYYGPYYGPNVFGRSYADKVWSSVKITETDKNSTKMIRICNKPYLAEDATCALLKASDEEDLTKPFRDSKPSTADGEGENWNDKIKSLTIPAGVKVTGWEHIVAEGKGNPYGPYYGPETLNELSTDKWSSLKVEETEEFSSSTVVKICSNEYLGGVCCHIEPPKSVGLDNAKEHSNTANNLCAYNYALSNQKIRSMKIPGGIMVEMYQSEDFKGRQYGPYAGPRVISQLDGTKKANEIVKSFRLIRMF